MTAQQAGVERLRQRINTALFVAAVLALCAAVLGGVVAVREHQEQREAGGGGVAPGQVEATYGEVLRAATVMVTDFVTLDYRDLDAGIEQVRKQSTGEFAKQYDASVDGLRELMKRNKSVMEGEVLSAGIVFADHDSATVLVSTRGTVVNTASQGEQQQRNNRIQLELVKSSDTWLVSSLQFVG